MRRAANRPDVALSTAMTKERITVEIDSKLLEAARMDAAARNVSLDHYMGLAVAYRLSRQAAAHYFSQWSRHADSADVLEILRRAGLGNPPVQGDELPDGYKASE